VARMRETRKVHRISVGHLLQSDHLEDREGDGRITLRRILGEVGRKCERSMELAQNRIRYGILTAVVQVSGFCRQKFS
jgi:hypothetical protein